MDEGEKRGNKIGEEEGQRESTGKRGQRMGTEKKGVEGKG
jgi:hypothetical protein